MQDGEKTTKIKHQGNINVKMKKSVKKLNHLNFLLHASRNYIICFMFTVLLCIGASILVVMIPRHAIQKNCEKSAMQFASEELFPLAVSGQSNTKIDNYADSILLNIIYCMNEKTPLKSVVRAQYYNREYTDVNIGLLEEVYSQNEPNIDYSRYWHGSMVMIRPLLCFTDWTTIKKIISIIICFFLLLIVGYLLKEKCYRELIVLLIGLVLIRFRITLLCIEYGNMMLVMTIMTFLYLIYERSGEQYIYRLCVINGVLTCFLDFLTIETISITVPVLLVLMKRKSQNRLADTKDTVLFCKKALCIWGMSYTGMFVFKWILTWIVNGSTSFWIATAQAKERIVGQPLQALYKNILMLFPIGENTNTVIKYSGVCLIIAVLVCTIIGLMKEAIYDKSVESTAMLLLMTVPYIRFIVLSNHSQIHCFFTYRAQLITIIVVLYVVLYRKIIDKHSDKKV